jgi:hypothetical protein
MELDNLIYIILIVIIFVVSLLGQNRKKKVPDPVLTNDEVKYSLNDFEKILERKPEYEKIDEPEKELETTIEAQQDNGIQADVKNHTEKHHDSKKESEVNDGFDINSAIIYSSILERKKFRH